MQPQNQPQIKLQLEQTTAFKCKACGKEVFRQIFFLRSVPALLSPTMRPEIVPVPSFMCIKCDTIAELNPKTTEKPQ